MKIECPECKLSGNIDESTVPATGIAMNCPRCKTYFTAARPAAGATTAEAMLDNCPSCQYATFSEEKFAVCPKCGLVVADYIRNRRQDKGPQKSTDRGQNPPSGRLTELQLRKDEEARSRYGLDKLPGQSEDSASGRITPAETPLPVLIIGWATVIAALVLLVYGGSGVFEYLEKLKEATTALQEDKEAFSEGALFMGYAFFPMLTILYSLAMIFFGSQVLRLRLWAVKALTAGAWIGIFLAVAMELTDMVAWCRRASSDASIGYYATGLLGGLLLAALWIIPLFVLKEYLNSAQFEEIEVHFS